MKKAGSISHPCLCVALLFCLFPLLPAETLTYQEVEGTATVIHSLTIHPTPSGFLVELSSSRPGGGAVRQTFQTAPDLSTLAWTFSDPERQMELSARRQGEVVTLSGSFRGRPVAKEFKTGGLPWNQLFQMGLENFALATAGSMKFCSIGTQRPGEMKMGKFTVTRENEEKILLGGKEIAAVRLRVSLSGLLSIFWHSDYWYRKSDGCFLRYRGKNRPGGPVAVSELVAEKVDESK